MSIADRYNKSKFDYPADLPWVRLADIAEANDPDRVYVVRGLYINERGKYGATALIFSDEFRTTLPAHLLNTVRQMLEDEEAIQTIKAGGLGFRVRPYRKKGGRYLTVHWEDVA